MRKLEVILNEIKPLMGSIIPEEREKLDVLMKELSELQLTDEEKKVSSAFFTEGILSIQKDISSINEKISMKEQLEDISQLVSLSYIAKKYFGKSRAWLYQRINGNKVRGKVYTFNEREKKIFNDAIQDIANRISSVYIR
ncbi:DUF5053 domain-containing protein [uncultured Bacteroides sp.]|uniref:DUF5053 domain-containing protein n=1 Tax=uncultured Bacteroides sp. TaxID=162156 RepID=UPI00262499CA|nr:DUF5053 domain-containing protein [uncultured Bacteroides sp.]